MCTIGVAFSLNATYVFKNRDLSQKVLMDGPEIREGKYRYVAFPRPGGGIWFGVNEMGVGLTASDAHVTKNYPVQKDAGDKITRIYEDIVGNASTLKEAEEIMTGSFKKMIKVPDMVIVTDSRKACVYEYTPEKQAIVRKVKGGLLRANSFLVLKGASCRKKDLSSRLRYERAREMIFKRISLAQVKKMLRDHKNGPGENSICRHGKKEGEYTTQYSAVAVIKKRVIDVYYVENENPCMGEYEKIRIRRKDS